MGESYRMLEDFGDFEQWERISDDGFTARAVIEKGSTVKDAFQAQDAGWRGEIWRDEDGYY